MGTGVAVNTGDLITAAKMNLKLEDLTDVAQLELLDQSGAGAQTLNFVVTENLTADRQLTLTVNDAARTIDLSGNLVLAGTLTTAAAFTTSGAFGLTLTVTALTDVTLPTTGTLATLAGIESLTNKTLTASVLSGTFTGTPTFSGATITFTGGAIALTGGAAYNLGTTDAFALILRANSANRLGISATIGQLTVYQTTGNYTLAFSDPAAGRTITFPDPLGSDSVVYLAAAQTLTNKTLTAPTLSGTVSGAVTFSGALTLTATPLNFTAGAAFVLGTTDAFDVIIKANNANRFAVDDTIGQLIVYQATGNYTLAFADPGAGRTITIADPGGAATLAYINQAQTVSAAHTFSGGPNFTRAGLTATFAETTDGASVQVAVFEGNRATPADNDAAYISLRLSDSAGNQDEGARITWQATTVLAGATQDTDMILSALVNNVLTTFITLDGSASEVVLAQNLRLPSAGSIFLVQAGGTYTVSWADPAANRALTIPDPLGDDTFVFIAMAQTLTNKTLTAPAITGGSAIELTSFSIRSSGAAFDMIQAMTEAIGADRTLTWTLNNANRAINLAGDLTLAAAFITSGANSLTLTTTGATDVTLPTTGTLATLTGTESLSGKTISMSGDLTFASALDIEMPANTEAALDIRAGAGGSYYNFDSRTAADNIIGHLLRVPDISYASAAGSTFSVAGIQALTITLTGGVGVTAMNGLCLDQAAPVLAAGQATTVTTASSVMLRPPTVGANMTITNRYIVNTSVAGCFLTAAGVWTDACSEIHKTDIQPAELSVIGRMLEELPVKTYRRRDTADGGYTRYGIIAEEAPDFLASKSKDGVSAQYMAGFALAALKWLQGEYARLTERVASLEMQRA